MPADPGHHTDPVDPKGAVADLYDEHPYPAHGVVSSVVARLASASLTALMGARGSSGPPVRVLDAGCGTGEQTLGLKRAFPGAEVVGIDLNPKSLVLAEQYAAKHSIDVRFEQADLLSDLTGLGSFDLVVSIGVLHHLEDPAVALRGLRAIAAEGGRLLAMFYGRYGKTPLFDARDATVIAVGDGARDDRLQVASDLRQGVNRGLGWLLGEAARRRRFGPDIAPIEAVRRVLAGRSAAYQADAFTHPQERAYTWAEIEVLLADSGWRADGWPKRSGLPDRPADLFKEPTASTVGRLSVPEQAAIYERLVRPSNLYVLASAAAPATDPASEPTHD